MILLCSAYWARASNLDYQHYDLAYIIETGELNGASILQAGFQPLEKDIINLDFQKNPVWLRVKLEGAVENTRLLIKLATLDSVEVFYSLDGELEKFYSSGIHQPIGERPVPHQMYAIPLDAAQGGGDVFFIRLRSNSPMQFSLEYHSEKSLFASLNAWDVGRGFFYGLLIVMFFYNLVISVITRDPAYYYYNLFVLFMGLSQAVLDGNFERFIYDMDGAENRMLTITFPVLAGLAGVEFTKVFLRLKQVAPKLNIGMNLLQGIYFIALLVLLFGSYELAYRNIDLAGALAGLYGFVVALYLAIKRHRAARLYLIAWSFFLASLILYIMRNLAILPLNTFTDNVLQIGIASQIVLLAVALADRINVLRKERAESQAKALRISKENEKLIRDQNIELERRVDERTTELQEANEELSVTLANLRDTQTQLVDAEKMASLGQLTAGIAHEINNPINFVSANIKPLSRDLEDLFEIIETYKQAEGEGWEEKLKRAHELRDELDFDFVREEVDDLLQGIAEGATRTSEIVKGLRTFSRLDEDAIKKADLHENITSTLVLLRSKVKDSIRIVEDFDEDLPLIECFPGKLNQVIMNIVNNAIYAVQHKKYPRGEDPTVTLKTKRIGDEVNLHIIDNGIGMDEKTQKKIFDPFFTTKEVGEGTGLGMSIVYRIVEKHRGKLNLNSKLGEGTEFIITLPVRQSNEFE